MKIKLKTRWSSFLLPASLLVGMAVAFLWSVAHLPRLTMNYSFKEFYPPTHPLLEQEQRFSKLFPSHNQAPFLVRIDDSNRIPQKKIQGIQNRIKSWKQVSEVKRLEDFPKKNSMVLSVFPTNSNSKNIAALSKKLHSTVSEPEQKLGLATAHILGIPELQVQAAKGLGSQLYILMSLSILIFIGLFFVFYQNTSPALVAALALIISNVLTLGTLAAAKIPMSLLMLTLPVLVSIAVVSNLLHTFNLVAEKKRLGHADSPWEVLKEIAGPSALASLTTAIGFLCLASSDLPAVRQYAYTTAIAMVATWIFCSLFLALVLRWIQPQPRSFFSEQSWWMVKLSAWSPYTFIATIGVTVALILGVQHLNFSIQLQNDLPTKHNLTKQMQRFEKDSGGILPISIELNLKNRDAWKQYANYAKLERLIQKLKKETKNEVGLITSLPQIFGEFRPHNQASLAENFLILESSQPKVLRSYVDPSFNSLRLDFYIRDLSTSDLHQLRQKIRKSSTQFFPRAQYKEAGLLVHSHGIQTEISKELVYGFWQSLLAISVMLLILFRSWRWTLLAVLPNLVPPAVLIGAMSLMQTQIKPGLAIIFSIALGLAFNNTVYILMRLRRLQRQLKMTRLPMRRTFLTEGGACLSESIIMAIGFSVFCFSSFPLLQVFGLYMLLSVVAGAWGDLVFLPGLIRETSFFFWKHQPQAPAPTKKILSPWGERFRATSPLAAFIVVLLAALNGQGNPSSHQKKIAQDILNAHQKKMALDVSSAQLELKTEGPQNENQAYSLQVHYLRKSEVLYSKFRIEKPNNLKNMSVLIHKSKSKPAQQWIYLPSRKQVRRVSLESTEQAKFLGSEFAPEDLDPLNSLKTATVNRIEYFQDQPQNPRLIEFLVPQKQKGNRTRVMLYFQKDGLVSKMETYLQRKKIKTLSFGSPRAVIGQKIFFHSLTAENHLNRRKSKIEFSEIKAPTQSLWKVSDFSPQRLAP